MALDLQPAFDTLTAALPDLAAVYLYGSEAAGRARPDSDVDLAVYAGRPIDRRRLFEIGLEVAEALGRDVDLVDMARASTVLQMEVLRAGPPILALRPYEAALMELAVMRDYYDLRIRRREIDAEIARRGRVHA